MQLTDHANRRLWERTSLTPAELRTLFRAGASLHLGTEPEKGVHYHAFYDYRARGVAVACVSRKRVISVLENHFSLPAGVRSASSREVKYRTRDLYYTRVLGYARRDLTALAVVLSLYGAAYDEELYREELIRVAYKNERFPDAGNLMPAFAHLIGEAYLRAAGQGLLSKGAARAKVSLVRVLDGSLVCRYPLRMHTLARMVVRVRGVVQVTVTIAAGDTSATQTVALRVGDANDAVSEARDVLRDVVIAVARSQSASQAAKVRYTLTIVEPQTGCELDTWTVYHERAMIDLF